MAITYSKKFEEEFQKESELVRYYNADKGLLYLFFIKGRNVELKRTVIITGIMAVSIAILFAAMVFMRTAA